MKWKIVLRIKEICADLNLWAINLKFLQILDNYVTYNPLKFQIDRNKTEAWGTHEAENCFAE